MEIIDALVEAVPPKKPGHIDPLAVATYPQGVIAVSPASELGDIRRSQPGVDAPDADFIPDSAGAWLYRKRGSGGPQNWNGPWKSGTLDPQTQTWGGLFE